MRSLIMACIRGVLVVLVLLSEAGAEPARGGDRLNIQDAKQGTARVESGEEIGSVIDFIIDMPTGRILFAVVSPTVLQGKAPSVLLLPWHLARVDSTGSVFDFQITTDTIRNVPRLSTKRWKQGPTPQLLTAIETHWHVPAAPPSLAPSRPAKALGKATSLIGTRVRGADNTLLGTIRELVFDSEDSAIAVVVLAQSPGSSEHDHVEFITMPWEQLYLQPRGNTLIAVSGRKVLT